MKKILLSILTLTSIGAIAQQVYVDKNAIGSNDGSSWTDAYVQLEDAFGNATTGMEIWVADGTYKRQSTDRNSVFSWNVDSVKVYGGFNGTETLLSQRDWITNRTIMSGDIGTIGDNSDNSYTVFRGPDGSSINILSYGLLDGFVMQDGNANIDGNDWGSNGAGYRNAEYNTKMEFHNCEFSNNTAKFGTGFYCYADNNDIELIVDACIFKNNIGRWGVGTQITSDNGAIMNATITNCLYVNNETKDMGSLGAGTNSVLYALALNPSPNFDLKVINTTFSNNQNNGTHASNFFGTIMCYSIPASGTKNLSVDNCIFWGNTGDTTSILTHPLGLDFTSIDVKNTISEYLPFPTIATTTNIINQDPLFTSSTDFTLQNGSPAIDAGTVIGLTIPTTDLAGNTRVIGGQIDLGCYEKPAAVGIIETSQNLDLTIYPNPTTGNITLDLSELDNATISIINSIGVEVFKTTSVTQNKPEVSLAEFSNGIYFIKVQSGNEFYTQKIIKQ